MALTRALTRRSLLKAAATVPALPGLFSAKAFAEERTFQHGLSLLGSVRHGPDFTHFDYVNPDAPKGGTIRLGLMGSFDSINPFTIKGDPIDPGVFETLMVSSLDEASTEYGLLAEGVWYPDDFSQAVFRLRPNAHFHDGEPVKPEDVIFSLDAVKTNLTTRAAYYKSIAKAEKTGPHEVTFSFTEKGNRELPFITGQLAVLPKHWWTTKDAKDKIRDVAVASLEPPLGSGPYRVADVKPGTSITLERVENYWGKDLAVNRGINNFDRVITQVFRDQTILTEAFKGDQFDVHREGTAKGWATGYDFPAVKDGRVIKLEVPQKDVKGMQGWVLNLRRPKFRDVRVRRAMNLAFDFEWSNANLFYGQYTRSRSYFNNSELEARGLPSPEELAYLEPLREKVPPEVFTTEFSNPVNATPQDRRKNLREAQRLLDEAGWKAVTTGTKRILKNAAGETLSVDFLLDSPAFERIALPYKEQLEVLGIQVAIRTIDPAQYVRQIESFDYDIISGLWGQSLSPGNEQREFWGSEFADHKRSKNYLGIKDEAIDSLVNQLITAPDRKSLVATCRALDRVLTWHHFVVPMWFLAHERIAHWKRVAHPDPLPGYSPGYPSIWWFDDKADAELKK